jgi:hypothetical protein
MKKLLVIAFVFGITIPVIAQPKFDLGLKGGINSSKLSLNLDDYNSESVTKSHFGAFGRIGWSRIFIQPEIYVSGKGGDLTSDVGNMITSFDYNTVDIPVLLGFRILKGKSLDLHLLAGPVWSNITKEDVEGGDVFNDSYYTDRYMSIQYGLGIDVWFMTFDARMENGLEEIYSMNGESFKNNTFLLSVGFKIF